MSTESRSSNKSKSKSSATHLTLVFINVLFVCLGLAAIVVGGWVLLYREEIRFLTLLDTINHNLGLLQNSAILLITCGIFLLVLGFLGCCATYQSQRCLRVVYICLVVLCCIITISTSIVVFIFRDQVEDKLLTDLQSQLKTDYQGYTPSEEDFSMALDWAQVEFECCGIQSYKDFEQATRWTLKNIGVVPFSCCVMSDKDAYLDDLFYMFKDTTCIRFPNSTNSYVDKPCYNLLKDWMEKEATYIGGIAIVGIVLEILAALFMIAVMRRPVKNMDHLYRDEHLYSG